MERINRFLKKNIKLILLIFLFSQPVIDIISSLQISYKVTNYSVGSIIRLLFLIFSVYYTIFISKEKNIKKIILTILYLGLFGFIILVDKGTPAFSYEMKNAINTYYIIFELLFLNSVIKEEDIKINIKTILYIFLTYIILVMIPNLTHTGFKSYYHSKVGSVGWFLSANAVGNILCILMPFIVYYIIKSKSNIFIKLFITISTLYVSFSIGTKVPILGIAIVVLYHGVYYLIKWIKEKKYKFIGIGLSALIICLVSGIIVVPKTSFYKNIEIHKKFLGINHYTEVFTSYHLVDHFIFSQRLTFLNDSFKNFKKIPIQEKIAGMGYIENYGKDNISLKTVEIDYFDILLRHGLIGSIIYFSIFISFIIKAFKDRNKDLIAKEMKLSIILTMLLAVFSGHIINAPTASIFVALIITLLVNKKYLTE